MKASAEGILYPKDAKAKLHLPASVGCLSSNVIEIPHASWNRCKNGLDEVFSSLQTLSPTHVFVLGPLHNGPIGPIDAVYAPLDGTLCGSDWEVLLSVPDSLKSYVAFSDDVCSEEHSLEIAAPYLSLLFPSAPVCHLLATGMCENVKKIAFEVKRDFPNALVFISNNSETCCAGMWKEAFI